MHGDRWGGNWNGECAGTLRSAQLAMLATSAEMPAAAYELGYLRLDLGHFAVFHCQVPCLLMNPHLPFCLAAALPSWNSRASSKRGGITHCWRWLTNPHLPDWACTGASPSLNFPTLRYCGPDAAQALRRRAATVAVVAPKMFFMLQLVDMWERRPHRPKAAGHGGLLAARLVVAAARAGGVACFAGCIIKGGVHVFLQVPE